MMRRIVGTPRHYAWGDATSIPEMFGLERGDGTWAEMWFGTHHLAPSHLDTPDGPPMVEVTGEMEMLVKILAAGRPLSLQTHPTRDQASHGHAREDASGIAVDAPQRMYRDRSDKPEVLVALTEFEALCGFRDDPGIIEMFTRLGWDEELAMFTGRGLGGYLAWCFTQLSGPELSSAPRWLNDIAALHPQDPGLRVAPLLHHVTLQPGQALCLPAGNLHAYLHGCGLEIMNSSDNVVRAGFTDKHIDPDELLSILDMSPLAEPVVGPDDGGWYPSPSPAFSVQRIAAEPHVTFAPESTPRIVFGPFISAESDHKPSMHLLAAGETGEMHCPHGGHLWVCRQG